MQKPVEQSDDMGGYEETWEDVATVWAFIKEPRVQTALKGDSVVSNLLWTITVRHINDVELNWRIIYEGREFEIEHRYPSGRMGKEWLVILCREEVRDG